MRNPKINMFFFQTDSLVLFYTIIHFTYNCNSSLIIKYGFPILYNIEISKFLTYNVILLNETIKLPVL